MTKRPITLATLWVCYCLCCIVSTRTLKAQSNVPLRSTLGSWNILNISYKHNARWSAFIEGQIRSLHFYDHFHYYEYKGAVNYHWHNDLILSLGMGDYDTYREGGNFRTPKNNDEFRLSPQLILNQKISRIAIEQRYRNEFRFTMRGTRNRFRYRLGLKLPLGSSTDTQSYGQRLYIVLNTELFIGNQPPYFERSRTTTAIGYKTPQGVTLQMGYVYQFDYRINDETGRDFLQLSLQYELKRKPKPLPTP